MAEYLKEYIKDRPQCARSKSISSRRRARTCRLDKSHRPTVVLAECVTAVRDALLSVHGDNAEESTATIARYSPEMMENRSCLEEVWKGWHGLDGTSPPLFDSSLTWEETLGSVKSGDTLSRVAGEHNTQIPQALYHERRMTPRSAANRDVMRCDARALAFDVTETKWKTWDVGTTTPRIGERATDNASYRTELALATERTRRESGDLDGDAARGSRPKLARRYKRQISIGACSLRADERSVVPLCVWTFHLEKKKKQEKEKHTAESRVELFYLASLSLSLPLSPPISLLQYMHVQPSYTTVHIVISMRIPRSIIFRHAREKGRWKIQ